MEPFHERVVGLIQEKGISQAQFCRELEFNKNTIKGWERSDPSLESLKLVADYFNVSTDYLVGLTDKRDVVSPTKKLSAKRIELLHFLENTDLTDKQSEIILKVVCKLKAFRCTK